MASIASSYRLTHIVAALAACTLSWSAAATSRQQVSSLLLKQTQEFSDAVQLGDAATIGRLLDRRVVFFNEGGDQATRSDLVEGASPPPPGSDVRMTVTDWHCEVFGAAAVASFVDEQVVRTQGQASRAQYRSVETWILSGRRWRMVGSETIALAVDPVSTTLSPTTLDEYVGLYRTGAGTTISISASGGEVFASLNDGPQTKQLAEVKDVLFTPGRARFRKVFQRDADGRVVALAYRREGHDTVFLKVSAPS